MSRTAPTAATPADSSQRSLLDLVLSPGSLQLMVQPIVLLGGESSEIHSFECLTRGPTGTNLERPDVLFEYVRLKRQEVAIDRACVEMAFRAMAGSDDCFSVNIHASTLGRDAAFVDFFAALARETSTRLDRVTVEIVEHAPVWNNPGFLAGLETLRRYGVRIALDDIGLGQSNFKMILECSPDYFKIDRYFVAGCDRDRHRMAVIESIFDLSTKFGGSVIAEGVESQDELDCLSRLGVRLIQGFYFSRPVAVGDRSQIQLRLRTVPNLGPNANGLCNSQTIRGGQA